jgi:hypothetical protein
MKPNELKQIIVEEIQKFFSEERLSKKELAALYPPKDKVTKGDFVALAKKKESAEEENLDEKHLTKPQTKKKEKLVKGMKSAKKDFEKRYPGRGEEVMYATATKMAQKKKGK